MGVVGKNYRLQDIQLSKSELTHEAFRRQLPAASQIERRLRGELRLKLALPCSSEAGGWKLSAGFDQPFIIRPAATSCKASGSILKPSAASFRLPACCERRAAAGFSQISPPPFPPAGSWRLEAGSWWRIPGSNR